MIALFVVAVLWAVITLTPHKAIAAEFIEPNPDCMIVGQFDGDHGGVWQSPLPTSGDDSPCVSPTPTPIETPYPSESPSPIPEQSATPSATPAPQLAPSRDDSPRGPFNAPTCGDSSVTQNVINPLVWRKGDQAKVQWWPSAGSQVNIYYKQVSSTVWQYSLRNQPNNGFAVINGLGSMDITFAIEQINGCAGGPVNLVKIVDGYTDGWRLFVP